MPFDTTYFFVNHNNSVRGTFSVKGGNDTSIYLSPGQVPSDIDSMFAAGDSAARMAYQLIIQTENTPTPPVNESYSPDAPFILIFLAIFSIIIYKFWKRSEVTETYSQTIFTNEEKPRRNNLLIFYGDELNFSDQQIAAILTKRFPYYNRLTQSWKITFIQRLQKFMADKTFKIHDVKGYKEMPVLISAAAIQLTFGLKKYLLPHFSFIHVHPQEFLRVQPILCFLEGNVSGHAIKLSWKHFLEGYARPDDGQNVGLHELAHALYFQTFEVEENVDNNFRDLYNNFNTDGDKAYDTEKTIAGGLYSEYAEKNFQEFWAESVEIFFEKPVEMQSHYPQLYKTMKELLNQDPINNNPLMIS